MKYSRLNDYVRGINDLVNLLAEVNKTQAIELWKFLAETLKCKISNLYTYACQLVTDNDKLVNECEKMSLTIKSQKGMLKKQGQEIVEQRKEIAKLKKEITEDKPKNHKKI